MLPALLCGKRRLSALFLHAALALFLAVTSRGFGQVQYSVLYSFCSAANCTDGGAPHGKLVFDKAGNLYGTTAGGGAYQGGTAFELQSSNGNWTESVLYSFCVNNVRNCPDGDAPAAGLTFDNAGNLYGTTEGGGAYGLGTVFELAAPPDPGGSWTETVLWSFGAPGDGKAPLSHLIFDASGNLYGTTSDGGPYLGGTVFQLVPTPGGPWSENTFFSFGQDPFNGFGPQAAVAFDKSGNLYGTTVAGGAHDNDGWGVLYKLSPNAQLPWTETVLFRFRKGTGANPRSAINFDGLGNLYGTLSGWGVNGAGGVFRLTPEGREHTVFFAGQPDAANPAAGVFIHGKTLYGTTQLGGSQNGGALFKLQRNTKTVLYSFCVQPNCTDGDHPSAALISRGSSLFGTATDGGANGKGGVVFQISESTPVRAKTASKKSSGASKIRPVATSSH